MSSIFDHPKNATEVCLGLRIKYGYIGENIGVYTEVMFGLYRVKGFRVAQV